MSAEEDEAGGSRRRWLLRALAVAALVAVAAGAVAAARGFGGTPKSQPSRKPLPVTRATLVDYKELDGELAYGEATPLASSATGKVTWLPAAGAARQPPGPAGGRRRDRHLRRLAQPGDRPRPSPPRSPPAPRRSRRSRKAVAGRPLDMWRRFS